MAVQADTSGQPATASQRWYARSPDEVAAALDVDPASGLSSARAAELLRANGPNALPEEKPKPGWRRFLDQYRSYMQLILVGAAVVSLVIKEWSTGVLLLVLTLLNAVIGLRQEGKAESAMNALKSMMKATARVRRDGVEAEIPAEQLVVGDVVLIAAGDQVPADGRIVAASALQIDESALTGESTPAAKDAAPLSGDELGPGDQMNMAFMNTPVTHGSATVIVTGTGADTELGKISGMLSATAQEQSPLTKELNTLTLWIAAAAGLTMVVMFVLGRSRGQAWDALFISAVALAIAAIPEALPTVSQAILSLGSLNLAKRNAIVKDLPSVETLGFTSAINSDKTGTLTMNQMTAVEVVDLTDRYTISGTGYGLEGKVQHAAGTSASIDDAILPYVLASDAKLVDGKVVGDPTEGALLVLGQGRPEHRRHPRAAAPAGHAAIRPRLQGDGHLPLGRRHHGTAGGALLRQGRCARGDGPGRHRPGGRQGRPLGRRAEPAGPGRDGTHGGRGPAGDGRRHARPRPGRLRPGR
jgi:Ca2+-transporting ATPase